MFFHLHKINKYEAISQRTVCAFKSIDDLKTTYFFSKHIGSWHRKWSLSKCFSSLTLQHTVLARYLHRYSGYNIATGHSPFRRSSSYDDFSVGGHTVDQFHNDNSCKTRILDVLLQEL